MPVNAPGNDGVNDGFVTLHPFDDGSGRLARAVSDYALAQGEHLLVRYYAMAASIMENRKGYYDTLESTQQGEGCITAWMHWFLETLQHTLEVALIRNDVVPQNINGWLKSVKPPLHAISRIC